MNAPASAADHRPPPIPDHELLRLIGRGSYGEVWLARNVMGTYRAVKIVHRDHFESTRPFDREFAGIQKYEPISRSHEGLVQVLHVGRASNGDSFYYVMELADDVAGATELDPPSYMPRTLRADIESRGAQSLDALLRAGLTLASALEHLHQHGLIHRDLKPSNIIFVNRRAKIADIGLVSEVGESRSCVGTEGFIPPEGPGSPAADVFSLGKTLYEANTGKDRLNFPEVPQAWLADSTAQPRFELQEAILKACENDATRRYQRAAELAADLAFLQSGRSVRGLHALERRLAWLKRAAVVALGAAGITFVLYWFAVRQAQHDRENLARVQHAEAEARHQLAAARLAQARSTHHSGLAGQRFDCLDVLAAAAHVEPTLELRNEAITALCLTDFRPTRRIHSVQIPSHAVLEPRGLKYVISGTNGLLTVHRAADDVEIARLPGALPAGWSIEDLSPGGDYISIGSAAGQVAVLNIPQGDRLLELPPQRGWFHQRFAPDGQHFLWCGSRHPWNLVDLTHRRVVAEWPVAKPIAGFQFRPDQQQLAVALADEPAVELHDLTTHEMVRRWELPSGQGTLVWDHEGRRLAGCGLDYAVRVWDVGTVTNFMTLTGHENLAGLAFHPTGQWMASSAWDGTTRLWNLRTGRQEALLREWGLSPRFTADGRYLCFCGGEGQDLVFCEVATEKPCLTLAAPAGDNAAPGCYDVAFDPGGRWLAAGFRDHLHIFDVGTARSVGTEDGNRIYAAQFAADGRQLFWGSEAGLMRARLNQPVEGEIRADTPTRVSAAPAPAYRILATTNVLAWNEGGTVVFQRDGATVARLLLNGQADSLALSRNGRWLAASELREPNRVYLWDTATWREVRRLAHPERPDREQLLFTPDNQYLIIGFLGEFQFLRLADGVIERRLPRVRYSSGPAFAACSPDGTLLALRYSGTSIALYAYPELRQLALLEPPHPADVGRLTFDPTGQRLAVAANGRDEVLLWDLALLRRQLAAVGLDW